MICPNCGYFQKCPCSNCQPRHGYEAPWLWVWPHPDADVTLCGYCGFECSDDEEWAQAEEIWADQAYRED